MSKGNEKKSKELILPIKLSKHLIDSILSLIGKVFGRLQLGFIPPLYIF